LKKYLPNMLSVFRIISSVLLIILINHTLLFIFFYFLIGLSDILDGIIARKFKLESNLGARLDSFADFLFYSILVFVFYKLFPVIISGKFKFVLLGIVLIRIANLIYTKIKYRKFVFVHTISNKISGFIIYFLPIIIIYTKNSMTVWIILLLALFAALEELLINLRYSEVNLNRKSLFSK